MSQCCNIPFPSDHILFRTSQYSILLGNKTESGYRKGSTSRITLINLSKHPGKRNNERLKSPHPQETTMRACIITCYFPKVAPFHYYAPPHSTSVLRRSCTAAKLTLENQQNYNHAVIGNEDCILPGFCASEFASAPLDLRYHHIHMQRNMHEHYRMSTYQMGTHNTWE